MTSVVVVVVVVVVRMEEERRFVSHIVENIKSEPVVFVVTRSQGNNTTIEQSLCFIHQLVGSTHPMDGKW
jgi:nucleoside diphosphate kinase